ncbi:hypothetical protein PPERSA_04119 [Pseudocohnilembus persalinus]|uniref:PCIF1 WW domain-containing protein n=1 Tax=Pseudocohnilembus persalinus TaxID=266149 RepID=A0A0V0QMK7_PSEPJ|nr:hypothetical protein PPERSA_04119 [Pseudocohnilembus persalinus]|eukprot:KRX03567.1 hypothetical protein PPERSA_04119 [Pseudocohnilembus persalinus]
MDFTGNNSKIRKKTFKNLSPERSYNNKIKYQPSKNHYIQLTIDSIRCQNFIKKNIKKEEQNQYLNDIKNAIKYYQDLAQYKYIFQDILKQCVIKECVHNVWNQWIIRVLGDQKSVKSSLPGHQQAIDDREETEIHMKLKLKDCVKNNKIESCNCEIKCKEVPKVYDDIIQFVKEKENEHRKNKNNSLENEQLLQIISDSVRINPFYRNKKDFNQDFLYLYNDENYTINILQENYDHISKMFDLNQNPQNIQSLKTFYIFELIFNYQFIGGIGYQWAFPPNMMKMLEEELKIECEVFASPLNHYFDQFHSLFDIDQYFGSYCSCLSNDIKDHIQGIEVNPPFVEKMMVKNSQRILDHIIQKQMKDEFFICFYCNPWKDSQAYQILAQEKSLVIDTIDFQRLKHHYFDITKREFQVSPFNSFVIVIGTSKAKAHYNQLIDIKKRIQNEFKSESNLSEKQELQFGVVFQKEEVEKDTKQE